MQVVSVSSNLTKTVMQQCGRIMQVNIHCACVLANVTTPNINQAHGRLGRTGSPASLQISHKDGGRESFLEII